jgi:chromosome segregation ATPase
VVSLKQSNTALKTEKHEWLHEKGELDECVRKCNHRCEELRGRLKEITESYEKKVRQVHELNETITKTRYENEELHVTIKDLRRQLDDEHCKWEDAEDQCGKWRLKWEHSDREIRSVREDIKVIEMEQTVLRETITKKTEELRVMTIEKERFEENYLDESERSKESHRQVIILQESLRRTETTLKEKTEIVHTLHERIERIEGERDEARRKCSDLSIEISQLQTSTMSLKLEIETVTEESKSCREKLHACETMYEEVCMTVSEYEEGNGGSEYEITNLRNMLREVREQKEKAIAMRNSADRERDEAIVKYEEKCRETERLEESFSQQLHSHGRTGGRTTTRFFGKSSASTANGWECE